MATLNYLKNEPKEYDLTHPKCISDSDSSYKRHQHQNQNGQSNVNHKIDDDFDVLLSEITIQFDDEVQTLYVGPVEIVDDEVRKSFSQNTPVNSTHLTAPCCGIDPKNGGGCSRQIEKINEDSSNTESNKIPPIINKEEPQLLDFAKLKQEYPNSSPGSDSGIENCPYESADLRLEPPCDETTDATINPNHNQPIILDVCKQEIEDSVTPSSENIPTEKPITPPITLNIEKTKRKYERKKKEKLQTNIDCKTEAASNDRAEDLTVRSSLNISEIESKVNGHRVNDGKHILSVHNKVKKEKKEPSRPKTPKIKEEPLSSDIDKSFKCIKCRMAFKTESWFKKHLINFHGIDLSNIAHFLSNLQPHELDEADNQASILHANDGHSAVNDEIGDNNLSDANKTENSNTETISNEMKIKKRKSKKVEAINEQKKNKHVMANDVGQREAVTSLELFSQTKMEANEEKVAGDNNRIYPAAMLKKGRRRKSSNNIHHPIIKTETMIKQEPVCYSEEPQIQPNVMGNAFVLEYMNEAAALMANNPNAMPDIINKENFAKREPPFGFPENLSMNLKTNFVMSFSDPNIIESDVGDEKKYSCGVCGASFDNRCSAGSHIAQAHPKIKRKTCPHCGRTFNATGDLTRHIRTHTGIKPFKCEFPECKYAFISSGDLHKHARRHTALTDPIPRPHVCDVCGKDFERAYDLKRHRTRHQMSDPNYEGFKCELCGKKFARKDQYRAHTYRHIGYKPYKCGVCEKTFSDASNYAKHCKIHNSSDIPLVCNFCGRSFKNKMAISKHIFSCQNRASLKPKKNQKVKG